MSKSICGAPLTDFVIDAGVCQRPLGHMGIHWFNDKSDRGADPEHNHGSYGCDDHCPAFDAGADPEPRTFACCPHDDLYDPKQHTEDGHGGCVICHFYVPHTDEEFERVRWPCTVARAQGGPSLELLRELADACEGVLQYVRLGSGPLGDDPAAIAMRRAIDALGVARARLGVAPNMHRPGCGGCACS